VNRHKLILIREVSDNVSERLFSCSESRTIDQEQLTKAFGLNVPYQGSSAIHREMHHSLLGACVSEELNCWPELIYIEAKKSEIMTPDSVLLQKPV